MTNKTASDLLALHTDLVHAGQHQIIGGSFHWDAGLLRIIEQFSDAPLPLDRLPPGDEALTEAFNGLLVLAREHPTVQIDDGSELETQTAINTAFTRFFVVGNHTA